MNPNYFRLSFKVKPKLDQSDAECLEKALEILALRGGVLRPLGGPHHHLFIPVNLEPTPFHRTLRECIAVSWVDAAYHPVILDKGAE